MLETDLGDRLRMGVMVVVVVVVRGGSSGDAGPISPSAI